METYPRENNRSEQNPPKVLSDDIKHKFMLV